MNIEKCTAADYATLVEIWERSVRASHDFLTEDVISEIKAALIPKYFPCVDLFAAVDDGAVTGFIGLSCDTIEMLFIDSSRCGLGYGSALVDFALRKGITKVDVNQQNPSAFEFYKAKGFRVISRDESDGDGRPYPILHLSL